MSFRVIVHIEGKSAKRSELVKLLKSIVQRLREADGCSQANFYEGLDDQDQFLLYESWNDVPGHKRFQTELRDDGSLKQLGEELSTRMWAETLFEER